MENQQQVNPTAAPIGQEKKDLPKEPIRYTEEEWKKRQAEQQGGVTRDAPGYGHK